MNNPAFNHSSRFAPRGPAASVKVAGISHHDHRIFRGGAAEQLQTIPVQATPLLAAQRLSFQSTPVMCVCHDYRAAQRHYCEATSAFTAGEQQPFIIHEMMPLFQQDYLLDCLKSMTDFALDFHAVVFTSAVFFRKLQSFAPHLVAGYKIVDVGSETRGASTISDSDAPTISCICLRIGAGGRWVLMDHEPAAVASPLIAPAPDLARRLLRHTVAITGARLAPYLAMMFDVPSAWKSDPELAACGLLIFHDDQCSTGCIQPGIPQTIIWNDLLGILCQG